MVMKSEHHYCSYTTPMIACLSAFFDRMITISYFLTDELLNVLPWQHNYNSRPKA